MDLSKVKTALLTVGVHVNRYAAIKRSPPYIVWAEDGQGQALHADDYMAGQVITGTIDYFTMTEDDGKVDAIQTALSNAEIPWRLESIQYETEEDGIPGMIHYEWAWEVIV